MKKIKYFLIDSITALIISVPCIFLFDWVGKKEIFNWLDIMLIACGVSIILIITNFILAQRNKCKKTKEIISTFATVATISTIMFGGFTLLEWLFPTTGSGFTSDWAHWFTLSISLSIFFHRQEKRKVQSLKSENTLVVAAECGTTAEAEKICAMLDDNGIKAMTVKRENIMFINNGTEAAIQIQVLEKELKKAKELVG